MREPYQEPRFGNRRWVAWRLVQLAARIYDAEYYERIYINDADGDLAFQAVIVSDLYGCGVSSIYGGIGESLSEGSTIYWDDDYRPEWLDED